MTEALARAKIRNAEIRKAQQDCLRAAADAGWVTGHKPEYRRRAAVAYMRAAQRFYDIEMSLWARECFLKAAECFAMGERPVRAAACTRRAEACPVYSNDFYGEVHSE